MTEINSDSKLLKIISGLVDGEGHDPHEAPLSGGPAEGDQLEDGTHSFRIAQERRKHGLVSRFGHGGRNSKGWRKSPGTVGIYEVHQMWKTWAHFGSIIISRPCMCLEGEYGVEWGICYTVRMNQ